MRHDRIPMKCGDEHDALGKKHTIHGMIARVRKLVKRRYNKRVRIYSKTGEQIMTAPENEEDTEEGGEYNQEQHDDDNDEWEATLNEESTENDEQQS